MRYTFQAHDTWQGEYAKVVGAELWVVGSDGSGPHKLLDSSDPAWTTLWEPYDEEGEPIPVPLPLTPSWSPDGCWIAVGSGGAGVLVDATTGELRRLSTPLGRWSPDGKRLLVVEDYPDRLVVLDLASGSKRTIDRSRHDFSHESPAWSPDGNQVAFIGCKDVDVLDCDVYVVGADGRGRKRITHTLGVESSLAWASTR